MAEKVPLEPSLGKSQGSHLGSKSMKQRYRGRRASGLRSSWLLGEPASEGVDAGVKGCEVREVSKALCVQLNKEFRFYSKHVGGP